MPIASCCTQLLSLLEAATRAADEADEVVAASRAVLAAACRTSGWSLGHLWVPDADGGLVSSGIWVGDPVRYPALRAAVAAARVHPGSGVVGRALAARAPEWTTDLP